MRRSSPDDRPTARPHAHLLAASAAFVGRRWLGLTLALDAKRVPIRNICRCPKQQSVYPEPVTGRMRLGV